jgi:hypothetical protein
MPVEQAAFGNRGPGHMTGTAAGMTFRAVKFPGLGQQGVFHLVRLGYGAGYVKNAGQFVVHGIFIGGGNFFMTFPAHTAAIGIGRIFYHVLMGFILIFDILALMAVDTAYFTMNRINKVSGNTERISAPHLRS